MRLLALAMCGSLLLVTTKLFGIAAGALSAGIAAIPFMVLWFAMPLSRLRMLDARHRNSARGR